MQPVSGGVRRPELRSLQAERRDVHNSERASYLFQMPGGTWEVKERERSQLELPGFWLGEPWMVVPFPEMGAAGEDDGFGF